MYAVERLSSYITRGVYTVSGPFHPFGGAVDIIVVQQQDGSFKSSPWNVRFGKFQGVLKTKEKIVNIRINGTDAKFDMYLDHKGEAYFLKDANQGEEETFMSPPSSGDETDERMKNGRMRNVQGSDCNESPEESAGQLNVENGKIVARTNSRGRRIFGFVFGRRTVKESGNIRNVERISSLERAEIAADLLEVNWSTNLPTNNQKGTSSLMPSNSESHVGNTPNTEGASSTQLSDFGFIHDDNVISHHEGISDTESSILTAEHIDETTSHGYPALRTFEEVIEIYSSETGMLADEDEVAASSPKAVEFDASFKESVTVNPDLDLYNYSFHKLSSEADGHLAADVSGEDNGDREVSSLFYCETSEGSNIMQNVSGSGEFEALNSLSIREQDRINTHETGQQASKETLNEQGVSYLKEDSDEYSFENLEVDDHMDDMQTDHVPGKICDKQVVTSIEYLPTESPSSHDVSLLTLESFGTKIADVLQEDILKKETDQEKAKKSETSDKPSEMDDGSPKPSDSTLGFNVDQTLSFCKEAKSHDISVLNTSDIVQEPHIPIENVKFDKCDLPCEDTISEESGSSVHASEVANADILLSESLDEDHLLFSEIHNFGSNEQSGEPIIAEETEAEDRVSIASDGSLEELESAAARHDGCYTDISEVSKIQTSPVSIPKHERNLEEKEQWVGSLPNIRSCIHELEMSDVPKTSRSLHVKSETSAWDMPDKDISSCPNMDSWTKSSISNKDMSNCPNIESRPESSMPDKFCFSFPNIDFRSESNLLRDLHPETMPENDDIQRMGEQNDMPINPAVEISLCKHLLFEGMGAEAASKAFDAEKVVLEKFAALGPSLVRNDKLVIRIAGRYFPWNAAAPIILGIASFGREGIFDAEGMIHVDGNDKALEKDPSSAIVPSGGMWRLWPFSSKKSQSMNPSHLSTKSTGITEKGTETGSMDNKEICDDSLQKSRVMKKKVRSFTPTTEQLASLNLKEGKNLVTFSFSTAMLGKQQVGARIYLWKWNTRIVISDVDGTITKSDVLGQFMPLVGKDWSQIGVAHLFSAIKENGYQLLFLSARAISQADLTRQFLCNLKQDGKALPDGPVVISPDGLFPSLYREVIRRAPHEFKISCLEEIRDLFPPECNPFYAGFGNRDTDEISYLKVGIPKGKIFIINPKGEVVVNHQVDTKSYTSLHALVNAMFPATSSSEQENYNSWNYWKLPLPDIDI